MNYINDIQETPIDVKPSIMEGDFSGNRDEHVHTYSSHVL